MALSKPFFRVTTTDAGSNNINLCRDTSDNGYVTSTFGEIRCTVNATYLVVGRETNRFLLAYSHGYVRGEDNNEDTPAITAGTLMGTLPLRKRSKQRANGGSISPVR